MKETVDIKKIEKEIDLLDDEELIRLLDSIVTRLKIKRRSRPLLDWRELYGTGKGLWEMDAQDYVNSLRKDR
ncbi:MAG: hypothetical protein U5L07_02690 [Desulfobacterales bacterium]|nr:hypothetical protein [Desulfobacterales bacterium]